MGLVNPGAKTFKPTPPEKGSFPLDHDAECKKEMTQFMSCLNANGKNGRLCRELSRAYLQCRMDHNLMKREDFALLGFRSGDATPGA